MTILLTALAGSVGALARYLVSGSVQRRSRSTMPVGTAAVNLLGALVLGMIAGAHDVPGTLSMVAIGFTGGFTTFSTWMVETTRLGSITRRSRRALANLVLLAALGVTLAALGYNLTN
jgi:fluoride exporter